MRLIAELEKAPDTEPTIPLHRPTRESHDHDVTVAGVGDLMVSIAQCCKPVPHDPIIGFITRGRGVTVHRKNCTNIQQFSDEERARLIDVAWTSRTAKTYPVDIKIEAFDRSGLIRDITSILAHERINVLALNTRTELVDLTVDFSMTVEIGDIDQLSRVLNRLSSLPNVYAVHRARR